MPVFGNNIQSPYDLSSPQEPKKKQTGTGFTNLQTMLNKNSGSQLGQTIGNGISGAASDVKSKLGDEQAQYGQQLGQAQSQFDPNKRDQLINQAGTSGQPDDETSKTFEKYRSGDLGAPDLSSGLKGYGDLSSKVADVAQQGKDVESQAGRYNLLQRYASGGKQYTAGQKRLDSMLLGRGGSDDLQQARLATGGIGTQLQQAQQGAQAQYGQATGQAKQFAADTEAKLAGATGAVDTDVDFANKQKALQDRYNQINQGLGQRPDDNYEEAHPGSQATFDKQQQAAAEELGIAGDYTYGMTGGQLAQFVYLHPEKMATASQFATPEQNAKMQALLKLSGKDINQSNWGTSAGNEASGAFSVSKDALAKELATRKAGEGDATKRENDAIASTTDWERQATEQIGRDEQQAANEYQATNPPPTQMLTDGEGGTYPNPQYQEQMTEYNKQLDQVKAGAAPTNYNFRLNRAQLPGYLQPTKQAQQAALEAKLAAYRGATLGKKIGG